MRHIPRVLGVCVVVLLAGCGALEAVVPVSTLPGPGPSVVFGEAHAPEGGRLVVGFLVPSPPPERLVDLVTEEDLAAFHAAEAARDAGDPAAEDEWVEEVEEIPADEEVWAVGEGWSLSSKQQAYRQQVARKIEANTGVHVAFRDLLADEIRDEAIVVVPRRSLGGLFADEVPLLEAYVARGGRLLRDDLEVSDVGRACPGITPEAQGAVRVLTNVCLDAIRTSPLVHRLPHDPLEVLAAERHGDEVRVRLRAEPTEAILRDFDARDVARIEDRSGGKIAFDCPDPGLDPLEHFLVATWRRGDLAWTRSWRVVDLVGTAERHLIASRTAEAGCSFAPRVLFLNSKTGAPVAGRADTLRLVDGDRIVATATGVSNAEGALEASLPIPADRAPGYLQLLVGKKRFPVYVRSGLRLSVVTDRGVYRSDDEVHVRVMVHDVARGNPVSDAEVTLTLAKEEKVVRTSEHGIASATFRVEGGRLGLRKLVAKARGIAAESTFVIRAFETPSFLVDVDAKRLEIRVGETTPFALVARHLNGTPLAGAKVWATGSEYLKHGARGETDDDGRFAFPLTLQAPARWCDLTLYVQDADGRVVEETVRVERVADDAAPRANTEADEETKPRPTDRLSLQTSPKVLTVGEPITIDLRGPDGPVWIDVARDQSVLRGLSATLVDGAARLELVLEDELAGPLEVRAWRFHKDQPYGVRSQVLVTRGRSLAVEAAPAQERYRPGETARLAVRVRDRLGQPTAAVLGYWGVDEGVLAIAPMPDGYEDVFDVLPAETTPDVRTLAAAKERGLTVDEAKAARLLATPSGVRNLYSVYRTRNRWGPEREAHYRERCEAAVAKRLEALRARYVEACAGIPLDELRTAFEVREILLQLARDGYLEVAALADPWGTPFAIGQGRGRWHEPSGPNSWWIHYGTPITSAGPDRAFGTLDDVFLAWRPHTHGDFPGTLGRFLRMVSREVGPDAPWRDAPFWGPAHHNGLIGLGGGAGGAFTGRGGSRDLGGGGGGKFVDSQRIHVREDFAPTLCFVPEVIVGPDGEATLEIPLKDQVTTWRMRLVASAADGATGIGASAIHVGQPLHADPWIAPHLTVGDELEVPVAVRVETEDAMDVALKFVLPDGLAAASETVAVLHVEPHRTGAHSFRMRAVAEGTFRVRIEAESDDFADVIERIVHVQPFGREVVHVANATLSAAEATTLTLPEPGDDARVTERRLQVYPGPLSETLAGLDGLIREPHGCFEQTSSTVYPMALAVQYLKRTEQLDPALQTRALRHLNSGYQRLLGYEVKEEPGGFSLWGKAPASLFLSAYALHEFRDMRKLTYTGNAYRRVVKYLASRQAEDGSWSPESRGAAHGDDHSLRRAYPLTAYVAWGLARAKKYDEKAMAWLMTHRTEIDAPYALALAALAFQAADPESSIARELVARLADARSVDEDGLYWDAGTPTNMRGRGRSAMLETTALVAQALLGDGRYPELTRAALDRIVMSRGRSGRFGSTQSTVLCLQALLAAESGGRRAEEARVLVSRGPEQQETLRLPPGLNEVAHLDLGTDTSPVEVGFEGGGDVRVALSRSAWVSWDTPLPAAGALRFEVTYPEGDLPVGEVAVADVVVRNPTERLAGTVTLEVGLPPGCTARAKDVEGEGAEHVERGETAMVIYLDDLAPGEALRFRIPFTPRYALDVVTAPSKAYEYYVPEEAILVAPQAVKASPAER